MRKFSLGEAKLLVQGHGIYIDDSYKEELVENYNCRHVLLNKIFINLIDNEGNLIPVYTILTNSVDSFVLRQDEKGYYLLKDGYYIRVQLNKKVESYDSIICGKKAGDIVRIKSSDHLAVTLNHYCYHFNNNKQCKFCNINNWPTHTRSNWEQLIETIRCYKQNNDIKHVSITTGSVNCDDKGLKGLIDFITKIRLSGVELPIATEFEPIRDFGYLEELKKLGVTTISCNIEILQENIRQLIMPGKGTLKFDEYIKTWLKCLELFGQNQVYSNVLMNTIEYDTKESISRLNEISSLGVIPSVGLLYPEKGTDLEMIDIPDVKLQNEYHEYNNLYISNNGLNPLEVKAGCPRNGSYSPIKEYYLDHKFTSRCIIAHKHFDVE